MDNTVDQLESWIHDVSGSKWSWYIKRLSGNDTQLTGGHGAGPYIPKQVIFTLFNSLATSQELNPRVKFPVTIDSDSAPEIIVKVIWYNNKIVTNNGTRNECRITNWGGNNSPLLDPEATGSLCVFSFHESANYDTDYCRVWLCNNVDEEDIIEGHVGNIDPSQWVYISRKTHTEIAASTKTTEPCLLKENELTDAWRKTFPSTAEIIQKVINLTPDFVSILPDKRLILRRDCEFTLFKSLESYFILPDVKSGFDSIDEFTDFANSVLNRRKSRSGRSLELQAKEIFLEEGLKDFAHDKCSEGKKRPDFIFPSVESYQNKSFPTEKLRMLAAKTTCKDRWRQVINEANRIEIKHLLTLQEGVSINQFKEMEKEGVKLVVPLSLHKNYHASIRDKLIDFDSFIQETKELYK